MGAEAKTTLRLGKEAFAGTALLETDELRFRGETRLRIPFASIRSIEVRGGTLRVTHAQGRAELDLGVTVAPRWAEKIRSPRSLAEKLGVKDGMQVAVLGVTDEAVLQNLASRGAIVVTGKVPTGVPLVLWRVTSAASLSKLPAITRKIARNGAIWAVHPRGVPSIADTVIFAAAKKAGLTATKVVRFSDVDTAEKLVIPVAAR
ncbi:MAG: hypothetical protein ABJA80_01805 [bacterium]